MAPPVIWPLNEGTYIPVQMIPLKQPKKVSYKKVFVYFDSLTLMLLVF